MGIDMCGMRGSVPEVCGWNEEVDGRPDCDCDGGGEVLGEIALDPSGSGDQGASAGLGLLFERDRAQVSLEGKPLVKGGNVHARSLVILDKLCFI